MFTSTYKCMVNLLFSYYNITHNDSSQNNNPDVSSPSTNTNTALLLSLISLGNNQISGILTWAAAHPSCTSTATGKSCVGIFIRGRTPAALQVKMTMKQKLFRLNRFSVRQTNYPDTHILTACHNPKYIMFIVIKQRFEKRVWVHVLYIIDQHCYKKYLQAIDR